MPGQVTTYDPTRVLCSIGGVQLTGFADGEAITIERDADQESAVAGVDGNVVRVINPSKLARVTVRLQGGAAANALLRAMRALYNPVLPQLDKGVFQMTDLNTGVSLISDIAWVSKEPLPNLSGEAPVSEWELTCAALNTVPIVSLA